MKMRIRCKICHTYRIEEGERRKLENEDENALVCLFCEEWLEGGDWDEEEEF